MSDLGTPALLVIFLAAALATWVAGVNLAKATDLLDDRYGLGEALVGGLGEAKLLEVGATEHAVVGVQPGWVQNPKPSLQTVVKVGGKAAAEAPSRSLIEPGRLRVSIGAGSLVWRAADAGLLHGWEQLG
jgi:hypothetical protein